MPKRRGGSSRTSRSTSSARPRSRSSTTSGTSGIQTSSPFLVTTSAGLVLFDATWDETADYVLENIRTAGFNPRDIRYLIITHAHIDHFAGAEKIRQATGARVGMSLPDWQETRARPEDSGAGPAEPGSAAQAGPGHRGRPDDHARRHHAEVLRHTRAHAGIDVDRTPGPRRRAHLPRAGSRRAGNPQRAMVEGVSRQHAAVEVARVRGT